MKIIITFLPPLFLCMVCIHMGYGPKTWEFYATIIGSTILEAIYVAFRVADVRYEMEDSMGSDDED